MKLSTPFRLSPWHETIEKLPSLRLALTAGVLVKGSISNIDLLLVGDVPKVKLKNALQEVEELEGRELNYSLLSYDEFYYRLSVRDKFITEILSGKHNVIVDSDNILNNPDEKEITRV